MSRLALLVVLVMGLLAANAATNQLSGAVLRKGLRTSPAIRAS
jgi:hypothetical protein